MKKYEIDIVQLENKDYQYEFDAGEEFFKDITIDGLVSGSFKVQVKLSKAETMLNFKFEMKGNLKLICDRSLDEFDRPFECENKLILKFADHDEELDEELRLINRNTQRVNLYQDLYDIVMLAIPMKKLHPRYNDWLADKSEGAVIYQTEVLESNNAESVEDPRWAALKNLKFNN